MLRNYLKITLRTLRKQPLYALINISGLAVGLACCIVMVLYVQDELTFDAFHSRADRIYRVLEQRTSPEGDVRHIGYTMGPAASALEADFPEIASAVRLVGSSNTGRFTVRRGDRRAYEGDHLFADPRFFEVFDFTLLQGDAGAALREPNTVVLTESAVALYFGGVDPMGEFLAIEGIGDFTVTGVLQDPPANSHLQFSMLFSFSTLEAFQGWYNFAQTWESDGFITYILLEEGADPDAVAARLEAFSNRYRPAEAWAARQLYFQPLRDAHFGSARVEFDRNANKGERAYLYIFAAIAVFVLLIGCINYMNLATARSVQRAKEVGLRKVVGAGRSQIIGQFLGESVGMTLLALVVAVGLVLAVLPVFNDFTDKTLVLGSTAGLLVLAVLAGVTAVVGLASGSYPALYLSGFRPARVLKGGARLSGGASRLRQALVVIQFALSIILIVATTGIYRQLQYIQQKNLGFNAEQLVVVDINSGGVRSNFQTIKDEYARLADVKAVTVTSRVPGDWKNVPTVEVQPPGAAADEALEATFMGVDEDFLAAYEVELAAGRNFSADLATDSTALILNETAARMLGWEAGTAADRSLRVLSADFGGSPQDVGLDGRVIGVVEDFHFRSLHEQIGPVVLGYRNNPVHSIDYFTLRVATDDLPATLAGLRAVHEQFDAVTPFEYNFLDERLAGAYEDDQRAGTIFGVVAALAIFIACCGLFGLAAFMAEQRTKEIGVRKVMGASVGSIVLLLSKDFTRLVLLAFVVAAPVAYIVTNRWLGGFAYHLEVGVWTLVLAGAGALVIAWLTVSYQSVKAAVSDPVKVLRYE